jgi:dTDP-4-amino-4,6-dideoxygalactose transaminase
LKKYAAARNEAAFWYDELLGNHPNIIIPKRHPNSTHVFHQYTIRVMSDELGVMSKEKFKEAHHSYLIPHQSNLRDEIRKKLSEKGIPTMVYYPIELHKQKAFEKYHVAGETFPVSERLVQTVLSLPMHTELTKEMVTFICTELIAALG